jgi:hypothetical protein
MTTATLTRRAGDRDAALAEGLDLTAFDPPACLPKPEPEIPAALPERVAVTLPKDRGADEAPVIYLARLDHDEIRRLRGEGLSWAELKTRFKLPGQVLRAVAGDVDPHQGDQDRAAARAASSAPSSTTAKPTTSSNGKPKRRRITYEENIAIAQRVEDGEDPATVGTDVGLARSTVMQTWRWAKREQLLDQAAAS